MTNMEILIVPIGIEWFIVNDACNPRCNARCSENCRRHCGFDFCGNF